MLSVAAVQARLIWVMETPLAARPAGAVGGCVSASSTAARNAAICMTHAPALPSVAVAVYEPVASTTRSSAMSPFGLVIPRDVKPVPAAVVHVATLFPATSRSRAFVVVTAGVALLLVEPVPATA